MKIIIDINHPAHVHYFKNTIKCLKDNDHEIIIVARDREFVKELLTDLNLPFINRGKGRNSLFGKFFYLIKADIQYLWIALKYKPDLFLSFSTPYIAQVAWLLGRPHIALNDTEHSDRMHSKTTYPFSSVIITPNCYQNNLGENHIRINCVIENFYLNEKYFVPDRNIKAVLNLKDNEEYIIFRFVSWNAHHDVGQSGLTNKTKMQLIDLLKNRFKIFISSEDKLPAEYKDYEINIPPEKIHDVLAFATIFIGESGTMASECALLGTKAIYINSLPLMGYLKLEEEAGLLKHFDNSDGVYDYVSELVLDSNFKSKTIKKSQELQKNFVNPTAFLTKYIENYSKNREVVK